MRLEDRRFYKMSGSGNDFIVFDAADGPTAELEAPAVIRTLCARGTGVGADGLVVVDRSGRNGPVMSYFNADGSRADLCGNATLCVTALSAALGADPRGFQVTADSIRIEARVIGGLPEIELEPVRGVKEAVPEIDLVPGERRIGHAVAGVPHLVILCDDLARVDVSGRGPMLRRHPALGAAGANVNWVSGDGSAWRYRTFERGVEGETLACGTGAVATASLLRSWGLATSPVELRTASGRQLIVTLPDSGTGRPALRGEARVVFEGRLKSIPLSG